MGKNAKCLLLNDTPKCRSRESALFPALDCPLPSVVSVASDQQHSKVPESGVRHVSGIGLSVTVCCVRVSCSTTLQSVGMLQMPETYFMTRKSF